MKKYFGLASRFRLQAGLTLIETMICALGAIVLGSMSVAGIKVASANAAGQSCGNNIRIMQESKRNFLTEHPTATTVTDWELAQYCPNHRLPVCPVHGTYAHTNDLTLTVECSLDSGRSDGMHNPYSPANPAPTKLPIKGPIGPTVDPGGPIEDPTVEPVEFTPAPFPGR